MKPLSALTALLVLAAALPARADDAIGALFAPVSARPDGPGCAVSAMKGGKSVEERVFGLANLETGTAITRDTVFEAGSVSKQFTAAAIAVLVAEGRMSLDDDIRRYLPEMRPEPVPITVRMLLTHTSGVRNWDDLVELAGAERGSAIFGQEEALALIARQSGLNFTPGSEYLYSNSNYVLAAVIVARVSGQSFDAFSRDALFLPAGMTRTRWRSDHTDIVPGRAEAYTPDDVGTLRIDMPFEDVVGPGGLLTTVGDLQRWNALLDRPTARTAGWVALLRDTGGRLGDGTPIRYGLGLEREEIAGQTTISHAGSTAGYRAYLSRTPSAGLSVAVLCNAGALNTEDLGPQLVGQFLPPAPKKPATPGPSPAVSPPAVEGGWRNVRTNARVEIKVDNAGVHLNGGPGFVAVAADRLMSPDGARDIRLTRSRDGGVVGLRISRLGNAAVDLVPAAPWSPTTGDLQAFVGRYRSEDADAVWTLGLEGGVLRARGPTTETFLIDPIYADGFSARDAYWTFVFDRGPDGAIQQFRAFKTRTRGVVFSRLTD